MDQPFSNPDLQGQMLADLNSSGAEFLIACGGAGGFGNRQFATNSNRTPTDALPGEEGEQVFAELELRLLADFGLVGLPNAGKGTVAGSSEKLIRILQ